MDSIANEDSPLHKEIGRIIMQLGLPNAEIILDRECGGNQTIQLFCTTIGSRGEKFCQVDAAFLVNNEVKVIIEIEESDQTPVRICGKAVASALAVYFIHDGCVYNKADRLFFVQVVGATSEGVTTGEITGELQYLEPEQQQRTSRQSQLFYLEPLLQNLIDPSKKKFLYDIFLGTPDEFRSESHKNDLLRHLRRAVADCEFWKQCSYLTEIEKAP